MIDVINKTYEQYREEIKSDIYAEQGEKVTCQNGHFISTFGCVTYVDDDPFPTDLPELNANTDYKQIDKCDICSTPFVRWFSGKPLKYGTCIQFWIDGEWRIRKYK